MIMQSNKLENKTLMTAYRPGIAINNLNYLSLETKFYQLGKNYLIILPDLGSHSGFSLHCFLYI